MAVSQGQGFSGNNLLNEQSIENWIFHNDQVLGKSLGLRHSAYHIGKIIMIHEKRRTFD